MFNNESFAIDKTPKGADEAIVDDASTVGAALTFADVTLVTGGAVPIAGDLSTLGTTKALLDIIPAADVASTIADTESATDKGRGSAGELLQLCTAVAYVNV